MRTLEQTGARNFVNGAASSGGSRPQSLLLTIDEAASLLRTTRKAVYAMVARRQLPGVTRIRRRVLVRADDLLDWLDQKRAPSPEE
jgi:excisionase family DNA binding protein